MDAASWKQLLKRIKGIEDRAVRYRQGVVTDDSPLSIVLGGSDVPYTGVAALPDTYTIGAPVAVLTFGPDLIILGIINGAAAGGGSAHTIQDEGSALTQRSALDFQGAGVTATDDAGGKTIVTIPGGTGLLGGANDVLEITWENAGNPSLVVPDDDFTYFATFDTEASDPGGWHAAGTSAIVPDIGGLFVVTCGGAWNDGTTAGVRSVRFRDDTAGADLLTIIRDGTERTPATHDDRTDVVVTGLVRIVAGRTYRMALFQNSGVDYLFWDAYLKMVRVAA